MLGRCFIFLGTVLMAATFGCKPEEGVTLKKVESMKVALISVQGPYSEIGPVFGELYGWLSKKGVQPAGLPFGIYYDNPDEVPPEECRYDICVPIAVQVESDERVQIKELPEIEVASFIHKGAYEKVNSSWKKVYTWIYRNNYKPAGPGREVYLNSPEEVPEDSLLTEIQVPIKKKT